MRRRHFLFSMSAALTACAGVRRQAPPQAGIDPPTAWRVPVYQGKALQADWWRLFGDAALDIQVTEALSRNDDIALAALRVQEARAQLEYAQARRLPNVQASLQGGRNRDVNPGFGIAEEQTAGEGLVQTSFDIDLFGRLKFASQAARATLLGTEDARETVRLGVAATVVSAYFALLASDARLAIVRDTAKVRRDELRVEQRRYAAGYSTALDLARAQAEQEAVEQLVPLIELSITRTENALSIVLGRLPGPIARSSTFDSQPLPEVPGSVPSALLRSRPDIAAAEARLAATDHALDAARAAFLPDIRLAASGGLVGSTLIDASPVRIWSFGSSILAPLYEGGRLRAQQDLATAQRDEAAFAYRKTALQAFREVEDNLAAASKYRLQFEALSRECDVLTRSLTLSTRRYREGYANYLDQLDAQRNLLSAELSLVQARLDRFNAVISLIQALGGGWIAGAREG